MDFRFTGAMPCGANVPGLQVYHGKWGRFWASDVIWSTPMSPTAGGSGWLEIGRSAPHGDAPPPHPPSRVRPGLDACLHHGQRKTIEDGYAPGGSIGRKADYSGLVLDERNLECVVHDKVEVAVDE